MQDVASSTSLALQKEGHCMREGLPWSMLGGLQASGSALVMKS